MPWGWSPAIAYRDDIETDMFDNLYEPIWDGGANGTPVNDNNYYALYLYNVMQSIGHRVKFWEIWNEPGFDFSGARGWLPPGADGNWWENDPDPCDYKLRAPIQHYIRTLRISYEVIKTLSPDDYVVMSGIGYNSFLDVVLRNTDNPDGGEVTSEFPLKGGAYFDIAGFHAYPHIDGSTRYYDNDLRDFVYTRHSDAAIEGLLETQEERRQILKSYGYDGSPYPVKGWTVTEINVPRQAFDEYFGSEELQVNYLSKLIVASMQNGIHQTHIFDMAEKEDFDDQEDSFDAMGLYEKIEDLIPFQQTITDGGISYRTTSNLLFGTTYDEARTDAMNLPDDIGGGAFLQSNGQYRYVLWAKTETDQSEFASETYSFPNNFGIANFEKRTWDYSENKNSSTVDDQNIQLTGTPIFLLPNNNADLGELTMSCPGGYKYDVASNEQDMGAVVTFPTPTATTTCPDGGVTITIEDGMPSGSLFPFGSTVVHFVATDACGNEEHCAITVNIASTGGGIGSCHFYRFNFNWRGNYEGNKYFVSRFDTTYQAALDIAADHGGHLVSIGDQAENDYLQREVKEVAFIGLNDIQQEGQVRWPDNTPVNFTNFDDCSFCQDNSASRDYVIFHPWNGEWTWTNDNDATERFFVMELPCSETGPCIDVDEDGICASDDCDDLDNNIPNNPGTACNDNNSNTTNDVIQADGCTCAGDAIPPIEECPTLVLGEGQITVSTFNTERTKIRLWSTEGGWEQVFECDFDCSDPTVITGLSGDYHIKIDAFDNDFQYICKVSENITIGTTGCTDVDNDGVCAQDDCNDNNPNLPATPGTNCNDNNPNTNNDVIQADGCTCVGEGTPPTNDCPIYTVGTGQITINTFNVPRTKIRLWNTDGSWEQVFECSFDCTDPTVITGLEGAYRLKIDAFDNDFQYLCKVDEDLTISGDPNGCTDADNDNVCAADDCNDNDPNLPATPGTSCNDNNPNTTNDVIQSDGCTCTGQETPPNNACATITTTSNSLTITGSQPNQIIKVFDANWEFVYQCSGDCPNPLFIPNLSPQVYHLKIDGYDANWNQECRLREEITLGSSGDFSSVTIGNQEYDVTVYPNPTTGRLSVNTQSLSGQSGTVQIFNAVGKLVHSQEVSDFGSDLVAFDLTDHTSGLYFISIQMVSGEVITRRVILQ